MAAPFYSIIIPSYNRAHLLKACLDSVLNQNFRDFEVLVIDDGSTDTSKAMLAAIDDERLRYFYKENGERGAARNYGIQRAIGKYICFLDSDDFYEPNLLLELYESLKQGEPACLVHGYKIGTPEAYEVKAIAKLSISDLCKMNRLPPIAVKVRRDVALEFLFSEDRNFIVAEDLYVWLRLFVKHHPLIHPSNACLLLQHEARSMNMPEVETILYSTQVMLAGLAKEAYFQSHPHLLRKLESAHYSLAALSAVLTKNNKEALRLLCRAVKLNWSDELFRKRNWAIVKRLLFR